MSECPICLKHAENQDAIYETDGWVIHSGPFESHLLGYLYIEPKRHVENWSDFTEKELLEIGPLFKKCEIALQGVLEVDRVYTLTISEVVRHLHFHIIPREEEQTVKGLPLMKQVTQQNEIYTDKVAGPEEWERFIKKIKQYFN
jgi:diadenosine tetraphosphate (Ap4A) HIT family hydrolase